MTIWRFWMTLVSVITALSLPVTVWADCKLKPPMGEWWATADNNAAKIPFGRVNLMDTYLQPPGTLLAVVDVPPENYTFGGANAETVFWECDADDLPYVSFLVSTNGDDRHGGYFDMAGSNPVPSDTYQTWFRGVGLHLSMGDVVLSRRWRTVPLTTANYEIAGNKLRIKLRHVPRLLAKLYRLGDYPTGKGLNNYCGGTGVDPTSTGQNYNCNQPNAYIQLYYNRPGRPRLAGDNPGDDHGKGDHAFWGANNGFGYGMLDAATLFNKASCVVRNNTPVVTFPAVSAQQLTQGTRLTQNFSVEIECSNGVQSGVDAGQVAMGFEVSPGANHGAIVILSAYHLVTPAGGITHLVDDCYDCAGHAKGVGVTLQNTAFKQSGDLRFVQYPGAARNDKGGDAGWYPVLSGATPTGSAGGYTKYKHDFTATFGQIKNIPVTPGSFSATATILVKVQ